MTGFATHFAMGGLKRKLGFFVVIKRFTPGRFHMAVLTTVPQMFVVAIIILVAAVTTRQNFSILNGGVMALIATYIGMGAAQREVSARVIKSVAIKRHDISVSAFVLTVTSTTGSLYQIGNPAVKSFFVFNILVDVFVTA